MKIPGAKSHAIRGGNVDFEERRIMLIRNLSRASFVGWQQDSSRRMQGGFRNENTCCDAHYQENRNCPNDNAEKPSGFHLLLDANFPVTEFRQFQEQRNGFRYCTVTVMVALVRPNSLVAYSV
jgi:hypothetical protein